MCGKSMIIQKKYFKIVARLCHVTIYAVRKLVAIHFLENFLIVSIYHKQNFNGLLIPQQKLFKK